MTIKFLQPVHTPRGNGYFIGYLSDMKHCQVAIREKGIVKNPIFDISDVTVEITHSKQKSAFHVEDAIKR